MRRHPLLGSLELTLTGHRHASDLFHNVPGLDSVAVVVVVSVDHESVRTDLSTGQGGHRIGGFLLLTGVDDLGGEGFGSVAGVDWNRHRVRLGDAFLHDDGDFQAFDDDDLFHLRTVPFF